MRASFPPATETPTSQSAYNLALVTISFLSRHGRQPGLISRLGFGFLLAVSLIANCHAQPGADSASAAGRGRILLVLPFDNRSGQPNLEWIREAAPDILGSRFLSAGFAPMSRTDRLYALDHLGLPAGFHPSRATALKLAQTLDADSIVVGSFITDGSGIIAEAQIVDVPHLRISKTISSRGEMKDLITVFDSLAWELTRQLDPGFSVAEETFVAAGQGTRLDAFEQYIRGISESDHEERLRHLNQAVTLSPVFGSAWMALGREDFNSQQYEQSAAAFAHAQGQVQGTDALEAGFYLGVSLLFSGSYPRAEKAFAGVAQVLPLAEVVNNQGVAISRQGHDGTALFRQAVAADANSPDFHFNLAVSLKRHGDIAGALNELAACLKLRPNDSEAQAMQEDWKQSAAHQPGEAKADPLERIARNFDAAAFRQAAQMLDQVDEARLAALSPEQRAQKLSAQARDYLDHGLLLEAERLYQTALAADDRVAEVHAGLAEIRERTGDVQNARKEAVTSLDLIPTVPAYLVVARLDLAAGHLDDASYHVEQALKIDANNHAALDLRQQIEARKARK